jgi:hypothetical protein
MNAELYDKVRDLSVNIVNASENQQPDLESKAYLELKTLCESNQYSDLDHPIQWEALGDFSENPVDALAAYKKGLACSEKLELTEYKASILFAMAECYLEQGKIDDAAQFSLLAQHQAEGGKNEQLKSAIREFLA